MAGINVGLEYEDKGYKPLMSIEEAKELADHSDTKCPKCGITPDSTFDKVLIHRYGICHQCLANSGG